MSGGARLALADRRAGYGGELGLFWCFYLEYPQLLSGGNSDAPRRKSTAAVSLEIPHAPRGQSVLMPSIASKPARKRKPKKKRSSKP